MIAHFKLVAAVVASIGIFGGALRAADDDAVLKKIRDDSAEINDVGNAFGRACGAALNDNAQDKLDAARLRYVDCVLLLRRLTVAAPDLEVEDGVEGRALKIAYEKWLKAQADNMQTAGLDYIEIVEDEDLTATERKDKLLELVKRQTEIEKPFNERLNDAMQAYEVR